MPNCIERYFHPFVSHIHSARCSDSKLFGMGVYGPDGDRSARIEVMFRWGDGCHLHVWMVGLFRYKPVFCDEN